jgi:hypothetical protein
MTLFIGGISRLQRLTRTGQSAAPHQKSPLCKLLEERLGKAWLANYYTVVCRYVDRGKVRWKALTRLFRRSLQTLVGSFLWSLLSL